MGLVLWIDQNTFASSLLEKIFKEQGSPFYTIAHVRDFAYLIEDLRPEVIVLDRETALNDEELFKKQYESSEKMKETPFILIGEGRRPEFLARVLGTLERPFDPFKVPQIIKNFCKDTDRLSSKS